MTQTRVMTTTPPIGQAKSRSSDIGMVNRPAYKVEELLALRASASESVVSLDKFGKEDVIKEHVLRPSVSLNLQDHSRATALKSIKDEVFALPKSVTSLDKKASPTPSMRRGKADKLLKEHGSPPGLRVTAGGRIVPANFTPLSNPFQYSARGVKSNSGNYRSESDITTIRAFPNGEANPMFPPGDMPPYNGFQGAASGLPLFNPMPSFGGMWNGYGYSYPWAGQYPNHFNNPYSYLVPYAQQPQPAAAPQPQRLHYGDLSASELSANDGNELTVAIESHITAIETEHSRLTHEKLEFEREEIRRSSTFTAADKAKNTEEKRRYVLRLDALRKSVKELRKLKRQGFNYCDPMTLTGVSTPKTRKISATHYNGDGPTPSIESTELSAMATNVPEEVSKVTRTSTSPSRKRSHAIEIKPPHEANSKLKSGLNPNSPSYEPGKPVTTISSQENSIPKTPSPTNNENGTSSRTFVNITSANIHEHTFDRTSSGATASATSSPSTTDFFPHNAPEHSSTKFRTVQLAIPPTENGEPTILPSTQVEVTAKLNDELARQQPIFFVGLFDEFHGMPIRAAYINNPFYQAGRRERRFYGAFHLRDVASNSHLYDGNDGGAPMMHPEGFRNQSVWFCLGFCYSLLDINSSGSPELFKLPAFLYGHAHGLQYATFLRAESISIREAPRSRQPSTEMPRVSDAPSRSEMMTSPNTSFFQREEIQASLSKAMTDHSKQSSESMQKNPGLIVGNGRPTAPLSPSSGNAQHQGNPTSMKHGVDGTASKEPTLVNQTYTGQISPRRKSLPASPNSANEQHESPKRSPSKQIRNLARHFRTSGGTDKSSNSASNQASMDKRANAIRDGLKRLCS